MFESETHVGIRCEVKNCVASGHRAGERGQIEIIALDEFEVFIFQRAVQKFPLAGGKIIPAGDGFSLGEQPVNETCETIGFLEHAADDTAISKLIAPPAGTRTVTGTPASAGRKRPVRGLMT